MSIAENIKHIRTELEEACARSGRKPEEITLINVSKTKPVEMLMEAYEAGERCFGENRVQELQEKMPAMPEDVRWHMIGHLQTNKVKYIAGKVELIHSVDSLHLAREIDKQCASRGCVQDILLEVNMAGEASKFGTADEESNKELIRSISELHNIRLCGLMTVAPYTENAEDNRQYFRALRELAYGEMRGYFPEIPLLSMGMSGDYIVAAEEGATHVRVGSSIFGHRG